MSSAALILERFDPDRGSEDDSANAAVRADSAFIQRAREESYSEGFAAGQAAATAEASKEQQFLAAVCNAVETELNELQTLVNRQMSEAFRLILEKIFPQLAQNAFADEAAKAFAAIKLDADVASMTVAVSPEWAERLKSELEKLTPDGAITVSADPDLEGATAKAVWPGGGVEFNMDQAIAECLSTLEVAAQTLGNGTEK